MRPNRKATLRSQVPGAVICALAWYVFSFGLSIYVQYFNGFSMYGSLTTIVLVMLWLYFCMYIMMACAEFNVIFEDIFRKHTQNRKEKRKSRRLRAFPELGKNRISHWSSMGESSSPWRFIHVTYIESLEEFSGIRVVSRRLASSLLGDGVFLYHRKDLVTVKY